MRFRFGSAVCLCILFAGLAINPAQSAFGQHEAGKTDGPSKYLFVTNVELKPEQSSAYAKLETDEIQAMRAAKAPSHYLGMWSITGVTHVLFLHGFDSFAELQKNHEDTIAMTKLEDTIKADSTLEAPLIAERHASVYSFEKDLSLNAHLDLSKMRFMRIIVFHVRSGHDEDWKHLVKIISKAYESSIPEAQWAMFRKMYGVGSDNTYILVTPMESLSIVDGMQGDKRFHDAVGDDRLAMIQASADAAVESSESDLFAFGPEISYAPDSWLTASPDFWGKK